MIATTWYSLKNKKEEVKQIIIDSGKVFWNAK